MMLLEKQMSYSILNSVPARYDNVELYQKGLWVNNMIDQLVTANENLVVNLQTERMSRECFAKDGVHFNRKGKSQLCDRLCTIIKNKTSALQANKDNNIFLKEKISSIAVK